ncbi:MAG: class I SAM-dependent methyltransferase [Myxococcota bacterium]
MNDTFERSCEHWSEEAREEMEDFYALATVDYQHLAESRDWVSWFTAQKTAAGSRPLRLLDVACGSGKFPRALVKHAGLGADSIDPVDYALLDPSPFSIAETKRVLPAPFVAGAEYEETLQGLSAEPNSFDVVWATHALYALPADELDEAMKKFVRALRPGGAGFIAHSASDGHYVAFYRDFLEDFRGGSGTPYTSAEQIIEALGRCGASFSVEAIEYANGATDEHRDQVEGYLQRCAFDDSVSLDAMLGAPTVGKRLSAARSAGAWAFRQRVMLISISG